MDIGIDYRSYATKHLNLSSTSLDKYNTITTNVIEKTFEGVSVDIFSKLLTERIIFLGTEMDSDSSNIIKSQLLYLNHTDDSDIKIYIDSAGGQIYTSLGIIDIMELIDCDVQTINVGLAASMAAVLLASGTPGKRKSLKRSRTMIHQPLSYSGFQQASDMEIDVAQIKHVKKELYDILAETTGQTYERIEEDGDRDYWMNAKQAKKYGLVDKIITKL